ncbi:MAG: Hsp33 family molecular chaperone HslO [Firmicutes bacterium]|nr:Hsp33 family molecular chaperone HslO [Bacillota bacterium]
MVSLDKALIALDKSGSYRVYLAVTTTIAETAREIHGTTPVATAALGRVLTAGALMGIMMKQDSDKVTLQFKGDGPAREILVTAYGTGDVKGYISVPDLDLPLVNGKLAVGDAIGIGQLTCIRDIGLKEPYLGRIDLVSGEIADDLTAYFFISDQKESSVILGETIAETGAVQSAAGMIIQMMPDPKSGAVDALEAILKDAEPIAKLAEECRNDVLKARGAVLTEDSLADETLRTMLDRFFAKIPDEFRPEPLETRRVRWNCDCSRERIEEVLLSLGRTELARLADEDHGAELTCQFCRSAYKFTQEDLISLLKGERNVKC